MGTHQQRLGEALLMSTHNIWFCGQEKYRYFLVEKKKKKKKKAYQEQCTAVSKLEKLA